MKGLLQLAYIDGAVLNTKVTFVMCDVLTQADFLFSYYLMLSYGMEKVVCHFVIMQLLIAVLVSENQCIWLAVFICAACVKSGRQLECLEERQLS